jgi:hypothetical protein
MDSGASCHMTPRKDWISDYKPFQQRRPVRLADKTRIYAYGSGSVLTRYETDDTIYELVWDDCYYVPSLTVSLFSVTQIKNQGYDVLFTTGGAKLVHQQDNSICLMYGNDNPQLSSVDVCWQYVPPTQLEQAHVCEASSSVEGGTSHA